MRHPLDREPLAADHDDVQAPVVEALEDRRDGGARPGLADAGLVRVDEPELEVLLDALADQLAVTRLENVQGNLLRRQEHDPEREEPDLRHRPKGTLEPMAVERLESLLKDAFPDARELRVEDRTGGGDHFQVIVTAPSLSGLSLLDQHRRVNDALAEPLRDGTIHELRIKTRGTT